MEKTKKQIVYCLTLDSMTSVYFDIDDLCDGLKEEFENQDFEGIKDQKFIISVKEMTEREINELPEFEGF
ncbi:hypothetical protein [Aquimarina algiphila]|uniref:hypothetical protein n=1 Tax=Aquimarina algiphila TaxID=2047982 RepID=UPI0023306CEC|nr:hypothetical protein [Aquimarina algiphila]